MDQLILQPVMEGQLIASPSASGLPHSSMYKKRGVVHSTVLGISEGRVHKVHKQELLLKVKFLKPNPKKILKRRGCNPGTLYRRRQSLDSMQQLWTHSKVANV